METKVSVELGVGLDENALTLDELVFEAKRCLHEQVGPQLIRMILERLDRKLEREWKGRIKLSRGKKLCCRKPHYVQSQRVEKKLLSSLGMIAFEWTRLRCLNCGKSRIPLRDQLKLDRYQKKSAELERIVLEVLSEQSYRRTSEHLRAVGEIPVTKSTAHRWVMQSDADEIAPDRKKVKTLVADGTGYKKAGKAERGEVRLVVGVDGDGKVVPYGAWCDESWHEISKTIKKANHHPRVKFKPIAELLVSDGEDGLIRAMRRLTEDTQRCQWHIVHDLRYVMRYQDRAEAEETRQAQSGLAGVIGIELPKENLEEVPLDDRLELEIKSHQAEKHVEELIEDFKERGYKQAAIYLANAKNQMFSYVRRWLKTGVVHPKASSMIERMMREVGRRIKKIGFNWSPEGAAKMARIILKRITSAKEWEQHWKEKLGFNGGVKIELLKLDWA